ncbi:MAG TPA: acetamidase/formamidase family protein, partial [Coleofasciculaceae cyanobacterium]
MPEHPDDHSTPHHDSHSCPQCGAKAVSSPPEPEELDHPSHHPSQFLSKQSRRAFLTSLGAATALGTNMIGFLRHPQEAQAQTLQVADSIRDAGNIHTLKATPETCFWGFFDKDLPPVLTIDSGDIVYVEALTHHAGDAPDLLMDEGVKAVYEQVTDRGPGVHIMTGPIAVRGAEVGDTLMVRVLKT